MNAAKVSRNSVVKILNEKWKESKFLDSGWLSKKIMTCEMALKSLAMIFFSPKIVNDAKQKSGKFLSKTKSKIHSNVVDTNVSR